MYFKLLTQDCFGRENLIEIGGLGFGMSYVGSRLGKLMKIIDCDKLSN